MDQDSSKTSFEVQLPIGNSSCCCTVISIIQILNQVYWYYWYKTTKLFIMSHFM